MDFAVIWAVLPADERRRTRPVAGQDYWQKTRLRRWVALQIFNALLIERVKVTRENHPIRQMQQALEAGSSLIVFPEGTRNPDPRPRPFKPGLYHLHRDCREVPLIPVNLQNLNRMLPKGTFLPVPIITRITFGAPLADPPEDREAFLEHARDALERLNPIATP